MATSATATRSPSASRARPRKTATRRANGTAHRSNGALAPASAAGRALTATSLLKFVPPLVGPVARYVRRRPGRSLLLAALVAGGAYLLRGLIPPQEATG